MENNSLLRVNYSIFGMIQTTFSFHSPLTPHPYQGLGRGDWIGKRRMKTAFHPSPVSVALTTVQSLLLLLTLGINCWVRS